MEEWEFKMLTLEERWELVSERGTFLTTIVYYGHRSSLYSYESVFVEVIHSHDTDGIEGIAIVKGQDLDRYVNRIKVDY